MTVSDKKVWPTIVIHIHKKCAPAQELRVCAKPRFKSHIGERAIAVVVVEVSGVIREVCLDDVQPAVAIVIHGMGAHAGLLAPILVESHAGSDGNFTECAIVIVMKKHAGGRITRDVDIWPSVAVEISRQDCKTVVSPRLADSRLIADIGEGTFTIVVIERTSRSLQPAWATHDGNTFPLARSITSGYW